MCACGGGGGGGAEEENPPSSGFVFQQSEKVGQVVKVIKTRRHVGVVEVCHRLTLSFFFLLVILVPFLEDVNNILKCLAVDVDSPGLQLSLSHFVVGTRLFIFFLARGVVEVVDGGHHMLLIDDLNEKLTFVKGRVTMMLVREGTRRRQQGCCEGRRPKEKKTLKSEDK